MRKHWGAKEESFLKDLYENQGLSLIEIAPLLKRSKNSIQNKINKLHLRHSRGQTSLIKSRLNRGKNNAMFGKESPNKGKNKENSERVKKASIKLSQTRRSLIKQNKIKGLFKTGADNPRYGKHSWSFGLTKNSNEKLKQAAIKLSLIKRKQWDSLSEKDKDLIKKRMARVGATCKKRKTSIEITVSKILDSLNLNYIWGYEKDFFVFDFYLTELNTVIECQGDYWHANPLKYNAFNINQIQKRNIERDLKKITYIKNKGLQSLFFWEFDIKNNIDNIRNKIREISSSRNNQTTPD